MPRITPARREANRAQIIAAARRCFARDGFHQTSMPDIATEAGVAVGAPYRYFTGKDELILEIAGEAFRLIFDPIRRIVDAAENVTAADLVEAAMTRVSGDEAADAAGNTVPVDELLRCAVQSWAELLRDEGLRQRANTGFERVRGRVADALRAGQRAGTVPAELDPDRGSRVVMALLHGFVLQRTAFGLEDTAGFAHEVRLALRDASVLKLNEDRRPDGG
ncbi:TetR/AcrR family transcriptional regulator [Streptomyces sp. AC512_CC834]|uniref:TetR/AcrR family transcriptional regulator n=1 Tax=Streptomyces sp. AC512_CC834 TaxID=2823691 RepID=UPI001C263696|nr:TetR/AcrR family transcriptional regulator [Streptomyces sp. AC512_CC834]